MKNRQAELNVKEQKGTLTSEARQKSASTTEQKSATRKAE